ncbi:GNAT superfamily N-acetyltransferase [Arthrobacter ginsengisoli]|uniref:GNAT superfamily N-acetyltransferase n=1 Tax=Arthrobacter ginsengisoli TaxID=1356565 RepID=A0ABU1UFX5_9MICC|nr:GNAT family N-acetyltransferase [Arthrobacter ginsengisoli]MDR7084084.1 GNAT superfamily N-acetyltransferase [Arthrobacter ginsengisoli]
MAGNVWLMPLKNLDDDACAIKLGEIAGLDVTDAQRGFVGEPLRMVLIGLEEDSRHPFAIDANGSAVGVLTLQAGAATLAGWADDDSVWLLRGFLIDRRQQGKGLGTLAADAAVVAAAKLTAALGGGQTGVVLSVNELNPAGRAAYRKAGYEDRGQYLGGDSGPQRTMYRGF